MKRLHFLATGLVVLMAASAPGAAQAAGGMRAELAAPLDRPTEVIVDGRVWSCSGNACTSRGADPRPAVACRKLARKVGLVARFAAPRADLDTAALATCNQDLR